MTHDREEPIFHSITADGIKVAIKCFSDPDALAVFLKQHPEVTSVEADSSEKLVFEQAFKDRENLSVGVDDFVCWLDPQTPKPTPRPAFREGEGRS
jgi:hypothetical protein